MAFKMYIGQQTKWIFSSYHTYEKHDTFYPRKQEEQNEVTLIGYFFIKC